MYVWIISRPSVINGATDDIIDPLNDDDDDDDEAWKGVKVDSGELLEPEVIQFNNRNFMAVSGHHVWRQTGLYYKWNSNAASDRRKSVSKRGRA